MSVVEALEELRGSTDFLDHLAGLNRAAEDEKRRRKQFYEDLHEDTKAEFINGQVVVHSPVRLAHLETGSFITNLLVSFATWRDLGRVYSEKCLIQCTRNDYEPDLCFFDINKCADWKKDMLFFPPPDLVVEILSPSTASNDRTIKLQDYACHGVSEYWIVDADERTVEQHTRPDRGGYGKKERLAGNESLVSVAVKGFIVRVPAFFDAHENQRMFRELLGRL